MLSRVLWIIALFLVVNCATTVQSFGATIFDQGYIITPSNAAADKGSSFATGFNRVAGSFFIDTPATVTSVTFWGSFFNETSSPSSEVFEIQFFGDNGITPSVASLTTETTSTFVRTGAGSTDVAGQILDLYRYDVTLATPVVLTDVDPGEYWFSVHNISGSDGSFVWQEVDSVDGDLRKAMRNEFGGIDPWNVNQIDDVAFMLFGTVAVVPAPSSIYLALVGFAALIGLARLRSRCR